MWKKVSDRSAFEAKAKKQKATYEAKMEKYRKSSNYKKFQKEMLAWKIHSTKKPFRADPNAPKRNLSAYMIYGASVRSKIIKENPDMEVTEVMREQSVWWKGLSESERAPWNTNAAAAKKKYIAQVERYMKTADYRKYDKEKEAYKQEMLEKRNKLMGVKKRARTPTKSAKSPSKKKQKKRTTRRSRTPKASKSRSASRKSRTPKAPKSRRRASSSRSASRRSTSRKSRTPKASKSRSARRSTSRKA